MLQTRTHLFYIAPGEAIREHNADVCRGHSVKLSDMLLRVTRLERHKQWAHQLKTIKKYKDNCFYKHKSVPTRQLYYAFTLSGEDISESLNTLLTGSLSCVLKTEKGSGSDSATASCCCTHPLVRRVLTCLSCKILIEVILLLNYPNRTNGTVLVCDKTYYQT